MTKSLWATCTLFPHRSTALPSFQKVAYTCIIFAFQQAGTGSGLVFCGFCAEKRKSDGFPTTALPSLTELDKAIFITGAEEKVDASHQHMKSLIFSLFSCFLFQCSILDYSILYKNVHGQLSIRRPKKTLYSNFLKVLTWK